MPPFGEIKNNLETTNKFVVSLDITDKKIKQIKYKIEGNTLNFIIFPKDGNFSGSDISSRSSGSKYDLIITLNTPDLESLGLIYKDNKDFFHKTPIINIDNRSDNEEFSQINFIRQTAVSTSEILFSLFESYSKDLIDEDIATCLLTGLIYKTRNFKTTNITPHTLLTTSELISLGARREEIVNKLYRSRNLNVLKLWGRVLARLSGELDEKIIWSTISQMDFAKTHSGEKDLNDIIDELIVNIPKAKIIIIIYEKQEKTNQDINNPKTYTNAIIYSTRNINVMNLVKNYNPTGTKRLAQIRLDKSIKETEEEIINNIKGKLEKKSL